MKVYENKSVQFKLNKSVCNSKQKWNHDECQCECKELDDWGFCEKCYMWIPSMCDCECNNACKIDDHLNTKSCFGEKRFIGR